MVVKSRKNVLFFLLLFNFKDIVFKKQKSKKDAKPWANMSKEYILFIEGIRN